MSAWVFIQLHSLCCKGSLWCWEVAKHVSFGQLASNCCFICIFYKKKKKTPKNHNENKTKKLQGISSTCLGNPSFPDPKKLHKVQPKTKASRINVQGREGLFQVRWCSEAFGVLKRGEDSEDDFPPCSRHPQHIAALSFSCFTTKDKSNSSIHRSHPIDNNFNWNRQKCRFWESEWMLQDTL